MLYDICKKLSVSFKKLIIQTLPSATQRSLTASYFYFSCRPYQCQFCEYSSLNSHTVRKHQFVHVAPTVLETCQICNRQFKTKDNLRSHMDSHNPKKIFSCDHCDKTFNNLRGLKSHIGVRHVLNYYIYTSFI